MEYYGWVAALVTGSILVFGGMAIVLMGAHYHFLGLDSYTEEENREAARGLVFCSTAFWIPGMILMAYGVKGYTHKKRLVSLATYLKLYRRIKLSDVAVKMGRPESEIEMDLLACMHKGYINGYMDRNSGEFFVEGSVSQSHTGLKCPSCGSPSSKIVMSGETRVCEYCRSPMFPGEAYPGSTGHGHG